MKIMVINGPNMNFLGIREPEIYGRQTYADLVDYLTRCGEELGVEIDARQSNHEGAIIDMIQEAYGVCAGIVINPAAYTHTSIAIYDALKSVGIPVVEVHISDLSKREPFRQVSMTGKACAEVICGRGINGYRDAMEFIIAARKG